MRVFEHAAVWAVLGVSAWLIGSVPSASAQGTKPPSLAGTWRAGTTKMDVIVESWGEDCGPRPQPFTSAGGGIVNVDQVANQLVIRGRGQDIRSDTCWSRNPSMKKQSSGFSNNAWTTVCKTADADPREEQGSYTLRITGSDTLTYQDISRYNWALNNSRCVARFTTLQTLTRGRNSKPDQAPVAVSPQPVAPVLTPVQPSKTPVTVTPPPEPDEKDEKDEKACVPGAPRRFVLRPRRAEIEVGQRICFRPRISDAAGCLIRDLPVAWALTHSKALRGTLNNGCFTAGDTAAEAEGEFKVVATASGLRAEASVDVHPVDLSALIAKRMGSGALTGFEDTAPLDSSPKAVTRVATRNVPEPESTLPRKLLGFGLGIAATLLAVVALWLSRRKSEPPASSPSTPPPPPAYSDSDPSLAIIVDAETQPVLLPDSQRPAPAQPAPSQPASEAWICPTCRVGYPAQQATCPNDGSALMPYAEFAKKRRETAEEGVMRCPRCGSEFPADASFCSEDGTRLVRA